MKRSTRIALVVAGCAVLVIGAAWSVAPGVLESQLNRVEPHAPYEIREAVQKRHEGLLVADWHSDTLLWNRSLLDRASRGHVDVPRLVDGNVAIQMFTLVTMVPAGINYERNEMTSDMITMAAIAQRWPMRTWSSAYERAVYQTEKFHAFVREAPDRLQFVGDVETLERVLEARATGEPVVAGLLGIEGAHALDGEIENIDRLYDAGVRMVGLQHFFDNRLGGSLHGMSHAGLTDFGRAVVQRAQARQMIIDVAHSSPAVVEDVLDMSTRPIVVSHTGVYGACASARNISDVQMQRIAAAGGLIAMGYWEGAICEATPAGIVRAIRYAIDLVGVNHVALGSDYDGAITAPFDTSELVILTQEMIDQGFTETEIAQVMGENTRRFLLANLPASANNRGDQANR